MRRRAITYVFQSHGQLDILAERDRKITAICGADPGQVFRAIVGVVGNNERAVAQACLKQRQYRRIERLGAIQQHKIDTIRQIAGERLQRVAFANLHQIRQAAEQAQEAASRVAALGS